MCFKKGKQNAPDFPLTHTASSGEGYRIFFKLTGLIYSGAK
jgi:hypothetical protein